MSDTKVSLPDHLRSTLEPLALLLPKDLREQLSLSLADPGPSPEVSYSVLLSISRWSRTDEGESKLRAHALPISDYSMISLLAGTITSPSSKFPSYTPPDAAEEARKATTDRKAISAILNSLFSIGGAGFAAWWASGRTGWRDEWRVLFALGIAITVAITEGLLYLIWQSRVATSKRFRPKRRGPALMEQNDSTAEHTMMEKVGGDMLDGLRRRQTRAIDE